MSKKITKEDILADLILNNSNILHVIERFSIPLGIENNTVKEICNKYEIPLEAFITAVNIYNDTAYMPEFTRDFESIPGYLNYLYLSHQYFMGEKIPLIQSLVEKLLLELNSPKAKTIQTFFSKYIDEVTEHINYENELVFPYIEKLYDHFKNNIPLQEAKAYSIDIYGAHHSDIEALLMDLKNILIRFVSYKKTSTILRKVIQNLFELETDLYYHTRLENEVLIPLVAELENEIRH